MRVDSIKHIRYSELIIGSVEVVIFFKKILKQYYFILTRINLSNILRKS
jgi:hypothetical protein